MTQVEAKSWNRFLTRYFEIVPELLGAQHEFEFDGKTIEVVLPSEEAVSGYPSYHQEGAKTSSWQEVEGKDIPITLNIFSVDVIIKIDHKVNVPDQVLRQPPNAYDILEEKKQKQLDTLAKKYGSVAERAFDVWLRVLRWKTLNGLIGRPHIVSLQSGWGTYLIESTTGHRFWAEQVTFHLPNNRPVTLTEWNAVEQALHNKLSSPVYYDLMFDAAEYFRLEDLQRSVVDAAVACEIYMRQKLIQRLPAGLQDGVKKYIDEANIRRVLDNLLPEALDDGQRHMLDRINSSLHKLFNARNTILHLGEKSDLNIEECQRYLEATRKLLAIE